MKELKRQEDFSGVSQHQYWTKMQLIEDLEIHYFVLHIWPECPIGVFLLNTFHHKSVYLYPKTCHKRNVARTDYPV